jgi:hypothetical protein
VVFSYKKICNPTVGVKKLHHLPKMFKILPIFNVSIECQLFMLMKFFDLWAAGGKLDLQPEGLKTYRCHSMNFLIATWNRVLIFTHQKIEQD